MLYLSDTDCCAFDTLFGEFLTGKGIAELMDDWLKAEEGEEANDIFRNMLTNDQMLVYYGFEPAPGEEEARRQPIVL